MVRKKKKYKNVTKMNSSKVKVCVEVKEKDKNVCWQIF